MPCSGAAMAWRWRAQSLSYTDGTSDPLPELVAALEEENRTRYVRLAPTCCTAWHQVVTGCNTLPPSSLLRSKRWTAAPVLMALWAFAPERERAEWNG